MSPQWKTVLQRLKEVGRLEAMNDGREMLPRCSYRQRNTTWTSETYDGAGRGVNWGRDTQNCDMISDIPLSRSWYSRERAPSPFRGRLVTAVSRSRWMGTAICLQVEIKKGLGS